MTYELGVLAHAHGDKAHYYNHGNIAAKHDITI